MRNIIGVINLVEEFPKGIRKLNSYCQIGKQKDREFQVKTSGHAKPHWCK
jgi:hypothetical protein